MTPHSRHKPRSPHVVSALLALLLGVLLALSLAGNAMAASKCGQKVLADWFDNGRIDRLYPLHCYEEAIDAIPADLRDYADAEEVISRALQGALRGELVEGGIDPTPGDDPRSPGGPAGLGGSNGGSGDDPGGGSEATPEVDTTGPSSIPVPLLVLGGMSLALLAAGALGYVARRRQAASELGDIDDPTLG